MLSVTFELGVQLKAQGTGMCSDTAVQPTI
jgi:hypothetical protein